MVRTSLLFGFATVCLLSLVGAARAQGLIKVDRGDVEVTLYSDARLSSERSVDLKASFTHSPSLVVLRLMVDDGALVKKGDVLAMFDPSLAQLAVQERQLAIEQAKVTREDDAAAAEIARASHQRDLARIAAQIEMIGRELKTFEETSKLTLRRIELKFRQSTIAAETAVAAAKQKKDRESELAAEIARLETKGLETELQLTHDRFASEAKKLEATLQDLKHEHRIAMLTSEQHIKRMARQAELSRAAMSVLQRRLAECQAELERCVVRAPFDGRITLPAETPVLAAGESVNSGQTLMRIVDPTKLQVVAQIEENLITSVRPGQLVRLEARAVPNTVIRGKVAKVGTQSKQTAWIRPLAGANVPFYPSPTNERLSYPVTVELSGDLTGMRPEMAVAATIVLDTIKNVVRVPRRCLTVHGKGKATATLADGTKRQIEIGLVGGEYVEVVKGLTVGEEIVDQDRNEIRFPGLQGGRPIRDR